MKPHSKLMQEMYADSFPHPSPLVWDQCTVMKHSLKISNQTSTAYPYHLPDISKMSRCSNSHGIQHFYGRMKAGVWFIVYTASSELVILFYIHKSTRGPSHQDSNASVRYYNVTCKEHCTIGLATQVPLSAFVLDHYWFYIRLLSNKLRTESNRSLRSPIRKD